MKYSLVVFISKKNYFDCDKINNLDDKLKIILQMNLRFEFQLFLFKN